jgi:hypothetical protein
MEPVYKCYLYRDRDDRMGSNFMLQVGVFILCKKDNGTFVIKKSIDTYRYINTLFFLPLKTNINLYPSSLKYPETIPVYECMRGPCAQFAITHKQDAVSYFYENFRDEYFKIVKAEAMRRNYTLPWKNNDDAICFHLRFEDMSNAIDIDSTYGFNRYKTWVESGDFGKKYKKCLSDHQCPINLNTFEKKINELQKRYREKQIYIITHGRIPVKYMELVQKYELILLNSNKEEVDCWLMANCHTLVMTKSTFPIASAFYFQGKEIHYQVWPRWAALGVGSKYDNSGWIGFN